VAMPPEPPRREATPPTSGDPLAGQWEQLRPQLRSRWDRLTEAFRRWGGTAARDPDGRGWVSGRDHPVHEVWPESAKPTWAAIPPPAPSQAYPAREEPGLSRRSERRGRGPLGTAASAVLSRRAVRRSWPCRGLRGPGRVSIHQPWEAGAGDGRGRGRAPPARVDREGGDRLSDLSLRAKPPLTVHPRMIASTISNGVIARTVCGSWAGRGGSQGTRLLPATGPYRQHVGVYTQGWRLA
jgi:hypothetical protein